MHHFPPSHTRSRCASPPWKGAALAAALRPAVLAAAITAVSIAAISIAAARSKPQPAGTVPDSCEMPVLGRAVVAAALDGRSIALADGRLVRLPAIEAPLAAAAGDEAAREGSAAARATSALDALTHGRAVVLRAAGAASDRYGRLRAHVFVLREGLEHSVERDMVTSGFARAAPAGTGRACAAELLGAEATARDGRLGLWGDGGFAVLPADDPQALAAKRGAFTIVEGRVRSVRESGGTIYLNFGGRWAEDFTVTVAKRNERMMTTAGIDPKRLEKRRLRIRGWIEERGGPWIDVSAPEQIEILPGD